jgi:Tfp pilus assembly protein PilN
VRAINLIPPEEQRGRRTARLGAVSYLVVGVLAAVLVGVTALILTNNQVSDREAEVARLEQERAATQARAESLQAFADFRSMQEARTLTVTSLAQSRFDWERVLRELARVLPSNVWLVGLEGTVSPDVSLDSAVEVAGRSEVPALEMIGCTVGQENVGRFAAALRDIDGVTRVTVAKSEHPTGSESSSSATSDAATGGTGTGEECRTFDFITKFEIVAAFDAVPAPPVPGEAPAPTPPATGDEAVPSTQPQAQAEVQKGSQETKEATNLIPGT